MNLKYRAITANCGNDALGEVASQMLAEKLQRDDADFYVINCQELALDKTLLQLQSAVGPNYTVVCTAMMETHTKFLTQFHSNTGIASIAIYKSSLEVTCSSSRAVRRSGSRFAGGAYNKGCVISDLVIKNRETEGQFVIQTLGGHLDSGNSRKRNRDWQLINQAIAKDVTDWNSLVEALPHLRLSGYDANTRNKIMGGKAVNLWLTDTPDAEMQALQQIVIAGRHFSKQSTYKTTKPDITTAPDSKRAGYACGGMLDFIGIADGNMPDPGIIQSDVIQIGPEKDSDRDHDVLISPLQQYNKLSDFLRVKRQMATLLWRVAPNLTKEILALQDNEIDKAKLIEVYKLFLSPGGALDALLNIHLEKLNSYERLSGLSKFCSVGLKKDVSETLFPASPWLETVTLANMAALMDKLSQKKHAMNLLLMSLSQCYSESGCKKRLAWYRQLQDDLETGTYQQTKASRYFEKQILLEYLANFRNLERMLKDFKPNTPNEFYFVEKGREILLQIARLAGNKSDIAALDFKNLSQLSSVLDHCIISVEVVKNCGDVTLISEHLISLSKEVSGKAAAGWEALGESLVILACVALVITGVLALVSTGGSSMIIASFAGMALASLAVGVGIINQSCKTGLAKAVADYQLAMEYLCEEDSSNPDSLSPSGQGL